MYTMEDFKRDYVKKNFARLTPEEQREALEKLPPEERREVLQTVPLEDRLAGISAEQIRRYLERLTAAQPPERPKRRRKK
jgi:hypothetical protein